jgi:GNAT superfamily N-acetyltransferase
MVTDPSPTLSLRSACLADVPVIVAFNRALARETEDKDLDEETVDRGVRRLLADPGRGAYVVAAIDQGPGERVVGQLMLTREWSDWRDGWFLWIQSVFVDPGFRRRGVYRALHGHVLSLARRPAPPGERVCGVRLYVERDNRRAKIAYAAQGMSHNYDVMEHAL